ncbi:MAG: hypothetical protein U0324_05060 [Polyangiales bacterium]
MSDPPRLRDLPGGDDFARSLLRDAAPTRPFTAADAARLTAAVSQAGAASSGTWLSASALPKALAAVALVAAGAGAWRATRSSAPAAPVAVTRASVAAPAAAPARPPSPPVAAPSAVAARVVASAPFPVARTAPALVAPVALAPPPAAPVAAAPIVAVTHAPITPARPAVTAAAPSLAHAAPPRPAVAPAASDVAPPTLGDEVLAVTQARAALRNNPARAVEILARAERSVTRPQLLDERDLVHIEALVRLGRWAEARDRAIALEARAPRSPQSARARALLRGAP